MVKIKYVLFSLLFAAIAMGATSRYLEGNFWRNTARTATWTPPAATDTLVGRASTDTLTNKTLTTPTINSPTMAKIANLTSNGYVKTSGGDGTLGITSVANAFIELYQTIATASGDLIYGGASGTPTRLAKGTDGQILTLAAGVPTWANSSSSASYAMCAKDLSGNYSAGNTQSFSTSDFDNSGGAWNGSTTYTAPAAGVYQVSCTMRASSTNYANNTMSQRVYVAGSDVAQCNAWTAFGTGTPSSSGSTLVSVTSGQAITIVIQGGTSYPTDGSNGNRLCIHKVN